jgi:hypothetical protein
VLKEDIHVRERSHPAVYCLVHTAALAKATQNPVAHPPIPGSQDPTENQTCVMTYISQDDENAWHMSASTSKKELSLLDAYGHFFCGGPWSSCFSFCSIIIFSCSLVILGNSSASCTRTVQGEAPGTWTALP